ncbi:MAG: sugar ABC transporter permease, partial [Oceanospirillaceae bacterium]|nr:sugar ABC transporter permease [Oceanospirillaceae bacterium]
MTTKETSTVEQSAPSVTSYLKTHVRDYGMLIALVVIMAMFQFLTDGTLMRPVNLTNLFLQNSYIII